MIHQNRRVANARGYLLIPVLLMLSVVAAVAYLMNVEGALNASSVRNELDRVSARYVAEAGYTEAKWHLAQNTTCMGYTDLSETTFGSSNYAVRVSPTEGSPVVLNARGSRLSGAVQVLTRQVTSYAAPTTRTLQPGLSGKDTYLRAGGNEDNNFGVSDVLRVNNKSAEEVSLLRFDLSSLPRNTKVISATLTLRLQGGGSLEDGRIDLHRVTRDWAEGNEDGAEPSTAGATYEKYDGSGNFTAWASPGGDYDATPSDSLTIAALVPGEYAWNLSELVRAWVSGTQANYGMLLRASDGEVGKIEFNSSDHSGIGMRPKLTITFACECGRDCGDGVGANLLVSPMSSTVLAGVNLEDGDVALYDSIADVTDVAFSDTQIQPANLNAVHQLSNGNYVISASTDATINEFNFAAGDLVEFDPSAESASLYLNGVLFDGSADIDALHLLNDGHLLISTATDATIGGLNFSPDDVVDYDPIADTATMFFDGFLFGIAFPPTSVDALYVTDSGHLLLSTSSDAELGGLSFTSTDVVDYDPIANDAAIYATVIDSGVDLDALGSFTTTSALPPPPPKPTLCAGTFLDALHTLDYEGSDGSDDWSSGWVETNGESDGATEGDLQVIEDLGSYRLRVQDNNAGGERLAREVDLSGFVTATLSFDYRRFSLGDAGDYVAVEISTDGTNWIELDRFAGNASDLTYQSTALNIDSYLSAATQIRFSGSATLGNSDGVYFDNIFICAED